MAEKNIKLEKTVYGTESADRVLDRKFTELIQEKEPVDIKKLFRVYEELFFDIPKRGTQSHAALIKQSFDYVRDYEDPKDKQIDDLLEKRKSNHWYKRVWDLDHQQAHDMFSQNKIYTWEEILNG